MEPIVPHFASECLSHINKNKIEQPTYDKSILEEKNAKIVQINGKKRTN